jgi:DNA-binding MarR family transcriptional regulator
MKKLELNSDLKDIFDLILDISWFFSNQCFNEKCCDDLTLVEYMALKKIYESEGNNIQSIGHALNITKSGMSKIINKLEKKSYVLKKQSPIDGRLCCVKITEKGSNAIKNTANMYSDYLTEALSNLDYEKMKIENITDTLLKLYQALKKKGYINQAGIKN